MHHLRLASICTLTFLLFSGSPSFAENGITLDIVDKAPPEEIDADIRAQIAPKAYVLSTEDGPFFDIWLVPSLTASAKGTDTRGTLLNIEEISLLGAMVVHDVERYDFRDDPIDPGLYILRLAMQPKDGNHMGTAPFDTFAILLPNAKDAEVREFRDHETMVDMASEDTAAEHPPILSLQPLESTEGDYPRLHWDDEDEWEFLYLSMPTKIGEETVHLPLGLVIEGVGEL